MIFIDEELKVFHIQTENTSYIMKVLPSGHLCTLYYGDIIDINSTTDGLRLKHQIEVGGQVVYDSDDSTFNLNLQFLELPTYGKGDFREPMMHFRLDDGSRITDFKYSKHEIKAKPIIDSMPETKANQSDVETLVVTMTDSNAGLEIELLYTPFVNTDVIARRAIVKNVSQSDVTIEKALSMNLDLFSDDYFLTTFDGAWIRERMINKRQIGQGITKIDSKKGVSSADHNPFIVISEDKVNEKYGKCYGFGLIYSGNFEAVLEKNPYDLLRVQMGINSFDFYWRLKSK
ncbi:MAG TPA: glycoside hydrolase family 36 N-terminal domain-containing protein, partial [Bacillota bacterium]|nr:glycoside hydrolase family 36 N-terminal domain-containing protein [Bacillota bacterium]